MKSISLNGKTYKSLTSFCNEFGLKYSRFVNRLKLGYTVEEAMKEGRGKKNVDPQKYRWNLQPCSDHLGNSYGSKMEMCAAYKISPSNFSHRIERGYTLEEALTIKKRNKRAAMR